MSRKGTGPRLKPDSIHEGFRGRDIRAIDLLHLCRIVEEVGEASYEVNGYEFDHFSEIGDALRLSRKEKVEEFRCRNTTPERRRGVSVKLDRGVLYVYASNNDSYHVGVFTRLKAIMDERSRPNADPYAESVIKLNDLADAIAALPPAGPIAQPPGKTLGIPHHIWVYVGGIVAAVLGTVIAAGICKHFGWI